MKRRKWTPEQKTRVVLEGLRGRPVGEVCAEYAISQNQYYKWRDQFLAQAHKAFEPEHGAQRTAKLERENMKLKSLIGELTIELKKSGPFG
ncbi:transposase [Desulfohalovibrio reitneri]|uniref:transposase n=1 Tax=Desulfohalovibrio reitneri TaxID=1307759 RepID=UPI0004A70310|nr:transposase [Desulfohalovibrio reitneri]